MHMYKIAPFCQKFKKKKMLGYLILAWKCKRMACLSLCFLPPVVKPWSCRDNCTVRKHCFKKKLINKEVFCCFLWLNCKSRERKKKNPRKIATPVNSCSCMYWCLEDFICVVGFFLYFHSRGKSLINDTFCSVMHRACESICHWGGHWTQFVIWRGRML